MCHGLLTCASFYAFLFRADQEIANAEREAGCLLCGGALHVANYPRKPRGGPAGLGADYDRRLSFCCGSCRRRATPRSLRFLGRKVYLGAFVVLATAMEQGLTEVRRSRLREEFGVSDRTLARWRHWWREVFGRSGFWRSLGGQFASPVEASRLPLALLERMGGDLREKTASFLRLVSPITTATSPRNAMAA